MTFLNKDDFYTVRLLASRQTPKLEDHSWSAVHDCLFRKEDGRKAFKILTGKPTRKRPFGRPRRRWEDNIRMHLEEIGINAGS